MPYLFAVFAVVWIVFALPESGVPYWKLVTGIVGIILIILALLGILPHYVVQ